MKGDIRLRPLVEADAMAFEEAFSAIGWSKPRKQFEAYLAEQSAGPRWISVAEIEGAPVGYVTVVWSSPDPTFHEAGIPEIMDLNVLPAVRRLGIGTSLMAEAERAAGERSAEVGLRVGLHQGYGSAQRLYVRLGYVPDGSGAISGHEVLREGEVVTLDDDATLRLRKTLTGPPPESYLAAVRRRVGRELLIVPSVAVVIHDPEGQLLLVRDRVSREWSLPAGAIELGESPEEAARRELFEETGIVPVQLSLTAGLGGAAFRYVYANGDRVEYQIFVFAGSSAEAPDRLDQDEVDRVEFFSRAGMPALALPYPDEVLWRGAS